MGGPPQVSVTLRKAILAAHPEAVAERRRAETIALETKALHVAVFEAPDGLLKVSERAAATTATVATLLRLTTHGDQGTPR